MTAKYSTKRSLIASILILCLCFTSLIGTTFAWFTDSVTSSGNKIVSGSLKVDLELLDKVNGWKSLKESNAPIFNYENWEPGYTDVKLLKVDNEGTLALKWKAKFVSSVALGELANVIDVYVLPYGVLTDNSSVTYPDDRDIESLGYTKVGTVAEFVNTIESTTYGTLKAGESAYLGIALKMQEDAGNEYQEADLGAFDIQIVAAQLASEEDSFGPDYDEGAQFSGEVGSADELIAALSNNENIKLSGDIDLSGTEWTPIASYSGILEGNGYTISNLTVNSTAADAGMFASLSGATIRNLTLADVNVTSTGNRTGAVAGQIAKDPTAPRTVIENVTVSGTVSGNYYTGGIVGAERSYDAVIKNCVNTAAVTGNQQVGGIVGQANRLTVIDSCSNSGTITADYVIAGGIIGFIAGDDKGGNSHLNVTVQNCTNTGSVSDSVGNLVGGIAGAVGRDGGDPIVDTITAYILGCTVANGQKLYGAKYNYCSGKDEKIVVITDDNAITSADDLVSLGGTKINGTYALMADIDMSGKVMKPMEVSGGATVTFIGNGHTISNLTLNAAGIHGMTGADNEVAGLFDLSAPATTVSLIVSDLYFENATVACDGYAGVVVGYNPNGGTVITLNNVDVVGATVTSDTVAALVGYTTGVVNLTDCDVSDLALTGEAGRPDKVGAYVGTANGATCVVTATNCTNDTEYKYAGRVIYDATMTVESLTYVTNADGLFTAVVTDGKDKVLLANGEYDMPNFGEGRVNGVTFIGESREGVVIKLYNATNGGDFCLAGSTATLEKMTIVTEIKDWAGFQNAKDLTFNECSFVNNLFLSGNATFNKCHFTVTTNHYNVWAYSANSRTYTAEFTDCVFDCVGKSIYIDGNATGSTTMKFTRCEFNDNDGGATDKAAIETGTTYGGGATYNVVITECEFDGFAVNPNGANTGSIIWANKNSMPADKLNITIDGTEVY